MTVMQNRSSQELYRLKYWVKMYVHVQRSYNFQLSAIFYTYQTTIFDEDKLLRRHNIRPGPTTHHLELHLVFET